jgi:predicted HAD superfamily Cof-like phosphohydrolase
MAHNESYPELLEELRASRERNIRLSVRNEELECMIAASQENEKIYHPQASVAEMMRAFGQEARRTPAMIEDSIERELTAKLVLEEALEFVEALGFTVNLSNGEINLHGELPTNLVEAVDAIGDILVVTYGAANRLGIRAYPIFQEVQRSNMSKVGPDGKIIRRKGDGKVLKPETYFHPTSKASLDGKAGTKRLSRPLKMRLHFNRVNMQRGNPKVWTASSSQRCMQATKILIQHKGKTILETIFSPESRQPRAYLVTYARMKVRGSTAIVEV